MNQSRAGTARLWGAAFGSAALGGLAFWLVEGNQPLQPVPTFVLERLAVARTGLPATVPRMPVSPAFEPVAPFLRSLSGGICLADWTGDGRPDLALTAADDARPLRLFRNLGDFRFVEVPAPPPTRRELDGAPADCAFVDVDNDGVLDLFVGGIFRGARLLAGLRDAAGVVTFVDRTLERGMPNRLTGYGSAFIDLDVDGDLDLLTAGFYPERYRPEDLSCSEAAGASGCEADPGAYREIDRVPLSPWTSPRHPPDHPHRGRFFMDSLGDASHGGHKRVFWNDGTGRFEEGSAEKLGLLGERWTHDIGAGDYDADGRLDLYFANDAGPDQLFHALPDGRFEPWTSWVPNSIGQDSSKGMNAEFADLDGDGWLDLYVTNLFNTIVPEGNFYWRNEPGTGAGGRTFSNLGYGAGAWDGGWGWGAKAGDLDLDGDLDVVSTGGLLTQDPGDDYFFHVARLGSGGQDWIRDFAHWTPIGTESISGHQLTAVFVSDEGRFQDLGPRVGLHESADGRGVALSDLDGDGRLDLVLYAQHEPPRIYRNRAFAKDGQPISKGVHLDLRAAEGAAPGSAVGARIEIHAGPVRVLTTDLVPTNGFAAQQDSTIHHGVPPGVEQVDVSVRWPRGGREWFRGLAVGDRHVLVAGRGRPSEPANSRSRELLPAVSAPLAP